MPSEELPLVIEVVNVGSRKPEPTPSIALPDSSLLKHAIVPPYGSMVKEQVKLDLYEENLEQSHGQQELIVNGNLIRPQQQCYPCKPMTFFDTGSSCSNPANSLILDNMSDPEDMFAKPYDHDVILSDFDFFNLTTVLPSLMPAESIGTKFVSNLISYFLNQGCISGECALEIVNRAFDIIDAEPNVVPITIPVNGTLTILGDIHGQFFDLIAILKKVGLPSTKHFFLANGDFVDRGKKSVETLLTLLCLKILMPKSVFLNRGNHESASLNRRYDFHVEFFMKFKNNHLLYSRIQALFNRLPLASLVQNSVFVTHGGIGKHGNATIQDILNLNRTCDPSDPAPAVPVNDLIIDLLWSDPRLEEGFGPSNRQISVHFGPDMTSDFLMKNNLTLIVRSHEAVDNGYQLTHDDQLVTIFSAPNYENTKNVAAVMNLLRNLSYEFVAIESTLPQRKP